MKPVNLNQLLFHPPCKTVSLYVPSLLSIGVNFENEYLGLIQELELTLELAGVFKKVEPNIRKIIKSHPEKAHGFFISKDLQGYVILEAPTDFFQSTQDQFYVRPLMEELFHNPEFMVVNVSLYDIKIYRGDFQHLEIIQQYEFDQLPKVFTEGPRVYAPEHIGLVPYKTISAIKSVAIKVMDMILYQSLPVIVTGLQEMKELFLKYFNHASGLISDVHEDFYEKTCVEILDRCKKFRSLIMDFYSSKLKERIMKLVKTKRLISDFQEIMMALKQGKVIQLILPIEKKLWGELDFENNTFEIHKSKKKSSIDVLATLADEVMKQGGRIQILRPHFFPSDSSVLAVLKG